jgi:hypothetical protein
VSSRPRRPWRLAVAAVTLLLVGNLTGCVDCEDADCGNGPGRYLPRTSEDNVLYNLRLAYRERSVEKYAELLAEDFRYFPDPATRQQLGIESWDRATELARIRCLFESPDVTKITIELGWAYRSATSAGLPSPRDTWTELVLTDVFLDIDFMPSGQEVTTFRIEDQAQQIFFRKGRTNPPAGPADTLVYIVEWRDLGTSQKALVGEESATWSGVKTLIGGCEGRPLRLNR